MLKTILPALLLCLAASSQAQYLETFSTPDKGYLLNFVDDFTGINWMLGPWDNQPPAAFGRDDADYFQTTAAGVLEAIDTDQRVCWESPLLNTVMAPGMVSFSVDLSWAGFDPDLAGNPCMDASFDYILVQYSVNGGAYVDVDNIIGGATCATIGYANGVPGNPFSGNTTISVSGIPGGGSLRIRVCVNVNANAEVVTIDNVSVPEMGVTVGCAAPELSLAVTPITCGGPNSGAIDLTVFGGTPNYTYTWSNGNLSKDLTGLSEGTYTVTVTDAANCTATASGTVVNSPFSISNDVGPATCEGIFDGSIDLIIAGGLQPYTVNWGDLPGSNNPEDRTGLEAGTYVVVVSDASGCTADADIIVGLAPGGPYNETFSVDGKGLLPGSSCPDSLAINCSNANFAGVNWTINALDTLDGIDPDDHFYTAGGVLIARDLDQVVCWESPLINTGGAAPGAVGFSLDLKWEGFDSEPAGMNPPDLVADHIDVEFSCDGGPWERLPNLIGNGVTGHTVVYADGSGNGNAGEATISQTALTCSNLRVRVCGLLNSNDETFSIDNVQVFGSTGLYCPLPELSAVATPASCFGAADGAIDLSLNGGEPPFTIEWSTGAMTEDINGLSAGTYFVTVTNNLGSRFLEVQVTEPAALVAAAVIDSNATCAGAADGGATAFATGGTTPYTYLWSNGATTASITGVVAGTYTTTITDANGCTSTAAAIITEPAALVAATVVDSNAACAGAADGGATAFATGGTTPYTYLWSNAATTASITGVVAGTYTTTITDANGCTSTAAAAITEPAALTASATATPTTGAMNNGTATVSAGGGTPSYTYVWSNGQTTATADGLAAGTYTSTVTDANGCTATATATVEQQMAAPGDACTEAIDISSLLGGPQNTAQTSALYDNTGYNASGDPAAGWDCFSDQQGPNLDHTIWFSFTGDGNTYRIRTVQCNATNYINGDGDTQMALYSGVCADPTPVACNDDEDLGNDVYNALLEIATQPGLTYQLMVDGWVGSGYPGTGEFCLEVTNLTPSAVTEIGKTGIRVFPNPTTGLVRISNLDAERVEVFDYTGRLFLQVRQPGNSIDLSTAPAGIYLLKLYAGDAAYSARLVKE
ncbi:MAG: T9SS type A sorting domain-containing protein [Lewinellaceae bacterium]|nr:T9SS type A sorting domain-containing protein [Lewinellaceae bacterium]